MPRRQTLPIELRARLMSEWVDRQIDALAPHISTQHMGMDVASDVMAATGVQARYLTCPPTTPEEERLSHSTAATPRAHESTGERR